jgi:CBS domain-containing membrane protein
MQGTQRLGVHAEWSHKHGTAGDAAWSALAPMALILIPTVLAIVVDSAFLFVSLGPIILQAIERPLAPASSPRSTILGNGIALAVGYACLAAFGLRAAPSSLDAGVTVTRAAAAVVAIGATGALITLVRAIHPPAGATTLLVTLGIVKDPERLAIVFAGVVLVSACACALDRLAKIPMPIWGPRTS